MQFQTAINARVPRLTLFQNPTRRPLCLVTRFQAPLFPSNLSLTSTPTDLRNRIITACNGPREELVNNDPEILAEGNGAIVSVPEKVKAVVEVKKSGSEKTLSIWDLLKLFVASIGPPAGLWIWGPLMSLIDTAVIGQSSSVELAALGPGTIICDYMSYVFMFLSIATSNMVATSLAKKDKNEVQHHISNLLFIGLVCGCLMLLFTKFFGSRALTAFAGPKNTHFVQAANTYIQIRGLAWPALLVGLVAQSASLGMKDSWGPLKALVAATVVNGIGDIVLCSFLGYGIAGAAWATMASQVIAAYMMIEALNKKGYNGFALSVPSPSELLTVLGLAAPVLVTMMSKVTFYSLTYFASSMGTHTLAAHQVMVQMFCMCTVWGEPLSQTAKSLVPKLMYEVPDKLEKTGIKQAEMRLKSLLIMGAGLGLLLGAVGTSVPWLFPKIFTHDQNVIREMHKVLLPYFYALALTPLIYIFERMLLAGRDVKFLSFTMTLCFSMGALVLLLGISKGRGLPGCWFILLVFQLFRLLLSLEYLPNGFYTLAICDDP